MPTKIYKKRIQNKEMYLLNKKKKLPIINKTCDKIKSPKKLLFRRPKKIKAKVVFPFHGYIEKWTNRLMNAVKLPLGIARIQCDDILKSSMMARKNNVQLYINSFSYLKKVINKNIKHNILIPKNEDIDFSFLCLILGPS